MSQKRSSSESARWIIGGIVLGILLGVIVGHRIFGIDTTLAVVVGIGIVAGTITMKLLNDRG